MNLIKLDATDSTNDFLKKMVRHQEIQNFTIVTAKQQTKGRGQMGAKWESEDGKNITISILVKDIVFDISQIYVLNIAVALSILNVLKWYQIPKLSIKWPNDIMAGSKKIGGILIENNIKSNSKIDSIVGIGLNVNQPDFLYLPAATSMKIESNSDFNLDEIIKKIVTEMQSNCDKIKQKKQAQLWQMYHQNLFKINVSMLFEDNNHNQFSGSIQCVSEQGKLLVLDTNNQLLTFGIKDIKMLY